MKVAHAAHIEVAAQFGRQRGGDELARGGMIVDYKTKGTEVTYSWGGNGCAQLFGK